MGRFKMVNGVNTPFSQEEEDQRDKEEAEWESKKSERAFLALRRDRDRFLAECDWTALSDSALSDADKKKWADYRKLLRDLPGTLDDTSVLEENITWPTKPS